MNKEFKKGFKDDLHRLSVTLVKCDVGQVSFSYCVPILFRFFSRYLWHAYNDKIYKK